MDWQPLYHWINELCQADTDQALNHALGKLTQLLQADSSLLFLVDLSTGETESFAAGLSPRSLAFMTDHSYEDRYLITYLERNQLGHAVCLQELLPRPLAEVNGFLERFAPHFDYRYSMGLILPLVNGRQLGLSCHRRRTPFPKGLEQILQGVGAALLPWAQLRLAPRLYPQLHLPALAERLTHAECQVLQLLARGMDGSEIARHRGVSKETVKSQIKSLLHKTNSRHQNHLLSRLRQKEFG
ncbi:helix-turn-helix transcriptional regulator [Ferrimonas sediminicola]|uniref:helix-turn-helix transcriptional regulator n=1 Tax=Ferrimonas sediminicola TaxID=2569538 RepID=UPI00197A701E|nr:helix-turn-helix transcriptional regulator [Ferrimonas sediminicola]